MSGPERFDAVVIGSGSGGRGVAKRLIAEGMSVAMVEQELVGGECPFWACIPSKALLRAPEVRQDARHAAGVGDPELDWEAIVEYRDYMNSALDDSAKAEQYSGLGIEIVRGRARIAGPGRVEVDGRELATERIVIATGTTSAAPLIDGLGSVDYWTNREATGLTEVPASAIVLGGGPVGIELGQMLHRFGADVTLVEAADRILAREAPSVSDQLTGLLEEEGIGVRLGERADAVRNVDGGVEVTLESGAKLTAEKLIVAVGRAPRVDDIGLEHVGIDARAGHIDVDEHCRAADGVWAVGDVTGVAPFTHVAAYQARIAVDDILGRPRPADYSAVPRVVFCMPEVACVGLTPAQAEERGLNVVTSTLDLKDNERTETYGRDLSGQLGVLADADRQVLVGAWAVGPLASEWISGLVVAIRAGVPIDVLRDTMMQFPSFSEAIVDAVRALEL